MNECQSVPKDLGRVLHKNDSIFHKSSTIES